MILCERIPVAPVGRPADANIMRQYEIQKAAWIWHPEKGKLDETVLDFRNTFSAEAETEVVLHVSGDQRYELSIDGTLMSCGPDRCDTRHWSFASYRVKLEKGAHEITARVWWIGEKAPQAQTSCRGGFILAAEGALADVLNTGTGAWTVAENKGWGYGGAISTEEYELYHDIGPSFIVDGEAHFAEQSFVPAAVVAGPIEDNIWGVAAEDWHLYPSRLPDQLHGEQAPGAIACVAVREELDAVTAADMNAAEKDAWQALIADGKTVTVSADTTVNVIWDLGDYYCGYEQINVSGGKDAIITYEWAESLYLKPEPGHSPRPKGNRGVVEGKVWWGFGSEFHADGGDDRQFRALWWRSGRFIMIKVKTGSEALTVNNLSFRETRYPLENDGEFVCTSELVQNLIPIAVRGMQMCDHELFADCPYYEQMMYVGDTRLQMLISGVMSPDDRLIKRGIEIFDWSRWKTGFTAERYPSRWFQLCPPFSMIWVMCIHDFALWHDDPAFVKAMLPGMRGVLEQFRTLLNDDSMLEDIPGWSFFEYVDEWFNGDPPDGTHGVSSLLNMLFIKALNDAAALEEAFGDELLAERNRRLSAAVSASVVRTCWSGEREMLADERSKTHFSEQAQVLALLLDILPDDKAAQSVDALLNATDIQRATVYFKFYVQEAFYKLGRGDLLLKDFEFWQALIDNGFKTPVERPEPSRSDCHAWGSHPLFHMHASLAGVRPDGFGFKRVRIAPCPGNLPQLKSVTPHPAGTIETKMSFTDGTAEAVITLPDGIDGVFVWNGREYPLNAGCETTVNAS